MVCYKHGISAVPEAPCTPGLSLPSCVMARASRADRRNDPREAWRPRRDTQSRPPGALDRCTGATGAVGTACNTRHHPWSHGHAHVTMAMKGLNLFGSVLQTASRRGKFANCTPEALTPPLCSA
jgi:hypothetical protein